MSSTPGTVLSSLLELEALDADLEIRIDEPMSRHTTLRLGGSADLWIRPGTALAARAFLQRCAAHRVPITSVGSGTNLLVRDGGIRGVVINLARLDAIARRGDSTTIDVEAGASTGKLLSKATAWHIGGLEFLAGVPGSVGGGLIMNAGTWLGEFTGVVTEVRSLTFAGEERIRDHDACGFRYRASDLPRDEIVVGATLTGTSRSPEAIEADAEQLREYRRTREPKAVPNSGSTFKNPPGDYAGRLIETAGLKGTRVGGAVVSPVHANWLVTDRGIAPKATAKDLLELIDLVRETVLKTHGVALELEVKVIGEN